MTAAKPWWQSWALWLNIMTIVALALGYIADNALQLGIPPQVGPWVALALAVVNALIRLFRTSQPLSIAGNIPAVGLKVGDPPRKMHPLEHAVPDAVPVNPAVSVLPPDKGATPPGA